MRMLSCIHADNEDVFESLLFSAYNDCADDEFLVYSHCDQDYRLRPPENWISSVTPYALYSVLPPDAEVPNYLHPSQVLNPEIEPYFF